MNRSEIAHILRSASAILNEDEFTVGQAPDASTVPSSRATPYSDCTHRPHRPALP